MNPMNSCLRVIVAARRAVSDLDPLHECLVSLIRAREQARNCWRSVELTVVDDSSPQRLAGLFNNQISGAVEFINNEGSAGQGGALNFALTVSRADVYAFTDSDCVVADDWLIRLAHAYEEWPLANGVAGPNWLHLPGVSRWTNWLTEQEGRLVRATFMRYIDHEGSTGRIDCRNLSLRRDFVEKVNADLKFFVEEGGPSVSGLTSHALRRRFAVSDLAIRFDPKLAVRHRSVSSLRREMKRYFGWGHRGNYETYYGDERWGLLVAFAMRYIRRHFIYPLIYGGVSPLYVSAVHGAYWLGIASRLMMKHTNSHQRIQTNQ